MLAHAVAELPNECCGLLAGRVTTKRDDDVPVGTVVRQFPLTNMAASRIEYVSDPRSMFDAYREMRSENLDVLAVYHSHPTSDPVPSRTDRERNYSPEVVNLIISLKDKRPLVRGWWLDESGHREATWRVIES
jgi:[CysO sulfur-carrier protein]-S-L-cysteine hydrolase